MIKTLLLPLSQTNSALTNVDYILKLARLLNADLLVAKLFKERPGAKGVLEGSPTLQDITSQEIIAFMNNYKTRGVRITAKPLEGDDWVEAVGKLHQKENIDLILLTPESHKLSEVNFLGEVSGALLKYSEIPVLIVPSDYTFTTIDRILMAVKSGIVKKKKSLDTIRSLKKATEAEIRLLQVKTADYLPEDSEFNETLGRIITSYKSTENATLFQGLLEHLNENKPDMICVFRRRRGFFNALWEENVIKRSDFESRIPLLVLKEAE